MCLIIDVNIAHKVLFCDDDPDFGEVNRRLFSPRTSNFKIVYGGKLLEEYMKSYSILRRIKLLDQAGKARAIDDKAVQIETKRVENLQLCKSDDPHIVALARCSNARVLCSHDRDLHTDFTNSDLIPQPRGKVFQTTKHLHLLKDPCP